jgi:hypothetical protein
MSGRVPRALFNMGVSRMGAARFDLLGAPQRAGRLRSPPGATSPVSVARNQERRTLGTRCSASVVWTTTCRRRCVLYLFAAAGTKRLNREFCRQNGLTHRLLLASFWAAAIGQQMRRGCGVSFHQQRT